MILTLTPNPTIDRVVFVRNFRLGAVVRGEREVITPSGKGVGSSLVIQELGGDTVATGLGAGLNGRLLTELLDHMEVSHDFVPADGETRMALVLVDLAVGQQSTIAAPTLRATNEHLAQLLALLDRYASPNPNPSLTALAGGRAWGVICGGSLPPGLPVDSYARLVRRARQLGLVTLLDSSGESLRQGVAGLPHILKVNRRELEALGLECCPEPIEERVVPHPLQREAKRLHSLKREAKRLHRFPNDVAGPGVVRTCFGPYLPLAESLVARLGEWASDALIVTLGERGALAVTPEACYLSRPPEVPVVNTAGAGDALSGGVMLALSRGADWPEALSRGTAAAASVVMNEGTAICRRGQMEELLPRVQVVEVASPLSVV
jgi:tagatose 6-phosphate kinase